MRSSTTRTKPGNPPLYEHSGSPWAFAVARKNSPGAFDQCPIFVGEHRMNLNFIKPVREAPGVKLILEPPRAFMIKTRVGRSLRFHRSVVLVLRFTTAVMRAGAGSVCAGVYSGRKLASSNLRPCGST